jgi:hypothetical protein
MRMRGWLRSKVLTESAKAATKGDGVNRRTLTGTAERLAAAVTPVASKTSTSASPIRRTTPGRRRVDLAAA